MMRYEYLTDSAFLKKVDLLRLKEQLVKITVLNWNEDPIQDIQGRVTGGTINIDGSSAIRRTANLSFFVANTEMNVTNPNSLLSINKKVRLEIGLKNTTDEYKEYDYIWYPMGVYVIIQSSISHNTGGTNISLQLKDKMCLLNGECGGTLPASITFSEIESIDKDGNQLITKPTVYQIIEEVVNHWGNEQLGRIIISDIDTRIKKVMKWVGATPLYRFQYGEKINDQWRINDWDLSTNESEILRKAQLAQSYPNQYQMMMYKYITGDDVGYIYSDFYYPGDELVGDAGSSVVDVLEKIKNALGNYEYFYDLDGNFIFQEIKNYLNTSQSTVELNKLNNDSYIVDQSKGKSVYDFDNSILINSYNNNPQFNMIKNDFIVWGVRKTSTDKEVPIRYHLAIDSKPEVGNIHNVFCYKDPDDGLVKAKATMNFASENALPAEGVAGVFYYAQGSSNVKAASGSQLHTSAGSRIKIPATGRIVQWTGEGYESVTGGYHTTVTSTDWRTELYLQGVDAEPFGTDSNYYYTELQSEWPKLYDIWGTEEKHITDAAGNVTTYTDPDFRDEARNTPGDCDFFLDFIDSSAAISEFSISNIGRRTKTLVDDSINCLFEPEIPDFVLIEADGDVSAETAECAERGQSYIQVNSNIYSCLTGGGGKNSAYAAIQDLLYQYTSYNESISIQCVPIYHLDVNTRIGVVDTESNISGDYIIKTISIPLDISGMTTIAANKALERF